MPKSELTAKQERFVEELLVDGNATQAAIRAGYSEKTARQVASQNLSKLNVQEAVFKARTELSERTNISQEQVVKGLRDEAEFTGEGTSHSARVAAWAHLGRHLGMFSDTLNLGAHESLASLMRGIDGATRGLPRDKPVQ